MFRIRQGNVLLSSEHDAICVTTNGMVMKNGELIMGAGVAKAFKEAYPDLPYILGVLVSTFGNNVHCPSGFVNPAVLSYPTKEKWQDPSNENLIVRSAQQLQKKIEEKKFSSVGLPFPGINNGGLKPEKVLSLISKHLDSDIVTLYTF